MRLNFEEIKHIVFLLGYSYLQNGKYHSAATCFRILRRLFPQEPQFALALGYCFYQEGKYKQALDEASVANAFWNKEEEKKACNLFICKALSKLGRLDEARKTFQKYKK